MQKKIKARLFQAPAIILLIIAPVIAAFYAKISGIVKISWFTPIIILLVAVLYFYGRYVENKAEFSF